MHKRFWIGEKVKVGPNTKSDPYEGCYEKPWFGTIIRVHGKGHLTSYDVQPNSGALPRNVPGFRLSRGEFP